MGCWRSANTAYFKSARLSRHLPSRIYKWKVACGVDGDFSVCSEHFFLKQPAKPYDENHPDWVPWLNMQAGKPDNPSFVQKRMQEYYEKQLPSSNEVCCITHCVNKVKSNADLKVFAFPVLETSSYLRRILSERRLLVWIEAIGQPQTWRHVNLHTLKVCSGHFVSGQMADLTDVQNIDWLPSQRLQQELNLSGRDHIAHFGLQNLLLLVMDGNSQNNTVKQSENIHRNNPPDISIDQRLNIGFKCILCLSNAALKPLTTMNNSSIHKFFRKKIRVKSELICCRCCKLVTEFDSYLESIHRIQNNVSEESIKSIIPLQTTETNRKDEIPLRAFKGNKDQLIEALPGNKFRCKLCRTFISSKSALNHHLFTTHRVKICCKLCKKKFSPTQFENHKPNCRTRASPVVVQPAKPAVQPSIVVDLTLKDTPSASTTNDKSEKYSCYICSKFFTPDEMKLHILTHNDTTNDSSKSVIPMADENYEVCKDRRCNRAIHKNEKEEHEKEHEEERKRLKELFQQQKARKIHSCAVCRISFETLADLELHRKHHVVFACSVCKSEHKNISALTRHQKEHVAEVYTKNPTAKYKQLALNNIERMQH